MHRAALVPAALLGAMPAGAAPCQNDRQGELQPIVGRVVDGGNPVAGAELVLRWRVHPELPGLFGISLGDRGVLESHHRADEEGRFRIAPPHRGPFLLLAEKEERHSAQVFPVMAGDVRRIELEPVHRVAGVVRDAAGTPIPDLEVRFVPHRTTWSRLGCYRLPERRAATRTDAQGRFALDFELGYLRGPWWGALHDRALARRPGGRSGGGDLDLLAGRGRGGARAHDRLLPALAE